MSALPPTWRGRGARGAGRSAPGEPEGHRPDPVDQGERRGDLGCREVAERHGDVEAGGAFGGAAEGDAEQVGPILAGALVGLGDVERDARGGAAELLGEVRVVGGEPGEERSEAAQEFEGAASGIRRTWKASPGGSRPARERTVTRAGNRRARSAPSAARAARVLSQVA